MSARKRYTNRINSRRSTGPKSRVGKVRVARNALRHGLGVFTLRDPAVAGEVGALARVIAGTNADAQLIAEAWPVAAAQVALRRASKARHDILSDLSREPAAAFDAIAAIERYEARARRRRKLAMAVLEVASRQARNARHAVAACEAGVEVEQATFYQTKPTDENTDPTAAYM